MSYTTFGLTADEVVSLRTHDHYSIIIVRTKQAADKVSEAVRGKRIEAGWLRNMELGHQTVHTETGYYQVMC